MQSFWLPSDSSFLQLSSSRQDSFDKINILFEAITFILLFKYYSIKSNIIFLKISFVERMKQIGRNTFREAIGKFMSSSFWSCTLLVSEKIRGEIKFVGRSIGRKRERHSAGCSWPISRAFVLRGPGLSLPELRSK